MATVSGSPSGPATLEYLDEKEWEQSRFYQAGLLEAKDLWQWDLLVSPVTKSYPFTLTQVSPSSTAAHLTVWLQGASNFEADPDHHLRVMVNGAPVGEVSWDGKTEKAITAELLPGILQEGANTLSLENVGDTAAAYSMVFLNRFALRYPRLLVAENGQIQGTFSDSGVATVSGLDVSASGQNLAGINEGIRLAHNLGKVFFGGEWTAPGSTPEPGYYHPGHFQYENRDLVCTARR
jgi:hypothetical protein